MIKISKNYHWDWTPHCKKIKQNKSRAYFSKEVWKSNFRQYGQMKSRGGAEEPRREEQKREEEKREEQKREDQRRASFRRKKIQVPEKVGKSRNNVFFQWFVAPEGRKVGSLKRRVARWEMKNCTPLWREAHFQVKRCKTHQLRTTFRSCDVAVVARSTFPSQKVQNAPAPDHFSKLRCRRCGAKHISKSKFTKHLTFGALLEVEMSKRRTLLWREANFEVNMLKAWYVRTAFWRSDVVSRGRRKGLCTLSKVSKTWGLLAFPKTMAGMGHFKRICKDAFSVAGAVQETCSSELLGGLGADFLRWVAFWSIRSSGLLRWFCRLTTTNLSCRFPIFETSATALCGTTWNTFKLLELPLTF